MVKLLSKQKVIGCVALYYFVENSFTKLKEVRGTGKMLAGFLFFILCSGRERKEERM